MRLAVFADIHGNAIALEAALADFEAAGGADKVWVLGDLAVLGTRPREVIRRLQALAEQRGKDNVQIIGGNTDRYLVHGKRPEMPAARDADAFRARVARWWEFDRMIHWTLEQLEWPDYEFLTQIIGRELSLHVPGYGHIIGFHAVPGDDEPISLLPTSPDEEAADALLDREGRLALAGHTHHRMDRTVGLWRVVNPGSVGLSFTHSGQAEWALLTFDQSDVVVDLRSVPYDLEAAIQEAHAIHPAPALAEARLRGQYP